MQKDERLKNHAPQLGASNQQLAIITQLLKGAPTLHHIDELLLWLAHSITERFDVQVSEFWTTQVVATDQPAKTELRAIASQDASLPRHVVWNSQVAAQAERTLQEQRHSTSAAVTSVFSAHQASLLNRYGLNYCCGYFLSTSSASTASCLLFTRSALPPPQNLLTSIVLTLDQAMAIAKNRGLSLPTRSPVPPNPHQQQPNLLELIARRSQNAELMRSSNPLASSVGSEDYLHQLVRWQIIVSLLALILLLLAPDVPDFPDPTVTRTVLSGSRGLLCFFIFFNYVAAFMTKQTRFSLLMSLSFLLISFGYFTLVPQYSFPHTQAVLLDNVGDVMRLFGLITLLTAVVTG